MPDAVGLDEGPPWDRGYAEKGNWGSSRTASPVRHPLPHPPLSGALRLGLFVR